MLRSHAAYVMVMRNTNYYVGNSQKAYLHNFQCRINTIHTFKSNNGLILESINGLKANENDFATMNFIIAGICSLLFVYTLTICYKMMKEITFQRFENSLFSSRKLK